MSEPRAILCDFTDFKRVATRNTFQLIFELPLEQAEEAIKLLGNPLPGKTLKCGIARVAQGSRAPGDVQRQEVEGSTPSASAKEKTKWQKLRPSAQAALRCDDPHFKLWLNTERSVIFHHWSGDAAKCVRAMCGIHSRRELDDNDRAALEWAKIDADYLDWSGQQRAQQQFDAHART